MAVYDFSIPKFHIESTRSRNSDTLYAGASLTVLNANGSLHQQYDPQNAYIGDKEDKTDVFINIPFNGVTIEDPTPENPDGGSITWAFLLTNTGSAPSGWTEIFNKALEAVAGGGAGKTFDGTSGGPVFIGIAVVALLAEGVLDFFSADCDGVVVTDAFSLTAAQLSAMTTASGTWSKSPRYFGTDSPSGCGDNSIYDVRWTVQQLAPFPSMQADWRSCSKCHSLFFAGLQGACPAGGTHTATGSFAYSTIYNAVGTPTLQDSWRSCRKCQCLHFTIPAACAGGGQHDDTGSFSYQVRHGVLGLGNLQTGWASCSKCRTLYFLEQGGPCPGGGQHDATGSWDYGVDFDPRAAPSK